jgi:hypothetical protein
MKKKQCYEPGRGKLIHFKIIVDFTKTEVQIG